jgi:hypothetical protein
MSQMAETKKRIDKTLDAENAMLLKHLLDMELRRLREDNGIDIVLFIGVDGRTFASNIPNTLSGPQFRLLNLIKGNLPYICGQLYAENLKFSIQQYKGNTVIITGVGDNAFLASLVAKELDLTNIQSLIKNLLRSSTVLRHVFELRPLTAEAMQGYDTDVVDELNKLSRLLFVEKFEDTRGFKRNQELLADFKKKIGSVVGVGNVEEVVTLTFNELGTNFAYMTSEQWMSFLNMAINQHIRKLRGDLVADECAKTWIPELERKLKSFV